MREIPVAVMRELFAVNAKNDQLGNAEPLPAIFPKGTAPVVALTEDGQRALWNTHWGFVLPQVSKKTGKPIQPKAVNNALTAPLRPRLMQLDCSALSSASNFMGVGRPAG